jgi:hypothetical protein
MMEKLAVEFRHDPLTLCWLDLDVLPPQQAKQWQAQLKASANRTLSNTNRSIHPPQLCVFSDVRASVQRLSLRSATRARRSQCFPRQPPSWSSSPSRNGLCGSLAVRYPKKSQLLVCSSDRTSDTHMYSY